ncbi:MAG: hypothetical protein ACREOB_07040 [Thermodesulfobacteriota bacterium]
MARDESYRGFPRLHLSQARITEQEEVMIIETMSCPVCGKSEYIGVDKEKYSKWALGEHIQDVWPEWTADQREMIITGTHPECWDKMMGEEE